MRKRVQFANYIYSLEKRYQGITRRICYLGSGYQPSNGIVLFLLESFCLLGIQLTL